MSSRTRISRVLITFVIAAFAALVASPVATAQVSSGEFTRAEANADWTQGSIAGSASWGGGCATAAPCEFQPYVTVGTSECSSSERRWPHSNAQLALAWSGAEQAGGGSASFDVSEVPLSGEPGQLACLSLLETYEERPYCQLHPQPSQACPMYIIDVQNSRVLASAPLSSPSSGPPVTSPPTIESVSVSGITATDATLEAQIVPNGLETTYEFHLTSPACQSEWPLVGPCFAISAFPLPSGSIHAGFGNQTVSLDLNSAGVNLQPGTWYEYAVTASNAAGEVTGHNVGEGPGVGHNFAGGGGEQNFKTLSDAPVIESESASGVTEHGATLEAQIDPSGQETRYEFQIDTTGSYNYTRPACPLGACEAIIVGESLPPGLVEPSPESIPAGSGDLSVSLDLTSIGATLQPGTTYHYRVIASNWGPVVTGTDQTFTTPAEPGPIPLGIQSPGGDGQPSSSVLQSPPAASSSPRRKHHRRHKRGLHRNSLHRASRPG